MKKNLKKDAIPKKRAHPRHFSIFKRYAPIKRFTVRALSPLDRVKKLLKDALSVNPLFLGVLLASLGIFLVVVLLFSHLNIYSFSPHHNTYVQSTPPHVKVVYSDIYSAGDIAYHNRLFYAILNISVSDNGGGHSSHLAKIVVKTAPVSVPRQIFVLRDPKRNPGFCDELVKSLQQQFKNNSISVLETDPAHIFTLPPASLLIIATDTMPPYLLNDSGPNLRTLSKQGISVLYVGKEFGKWFAFSPGQVKIDHLHFSSGSYVVKGYKSTYDYGGSAIIFGGISVLFSENSVFYFVPTIHTNPEWNGKPSLAAEDIHKIVLHSLMNNATNNTFTNFTVSWKGKSILYPVYSTLSPTPTKRIQITVYLLNESKTKASHVYPNATIYASGNYVYPAALYVDGDFNQFPHSILKKKQMLYYDFLPQYSQNLASCTLSLMAYSWNMTPLLSFPGIPLELSSGRSNVKPVFLKFLEWGKSKGNDYILELVAGGGKGVYGRGLVHVYDIKARLVGPLSSAVISHTYNFEFVGADTGKTLSLPDLRVYVDGKEIKSYNTAVSKVVLNFKQSPLPTGKHIILFKSHDWEYKYVLVKTNQSNPLFSPMFLATIVFVALLVIVATIFAKRGEEKYFLDVPDFPPFNENHVPVSRKEIVEMFERLEKTYRWKWIPLSVEELQRVFCTLVYKNRPVFVSEYNVHLLLSQLESKGIVQSAYGYYALTSWIKQSGKSITELALYRKIRDLCIRKAIYFSPIDLKARYDMELRIGDRRIFLFFMTPEKYGEKVSNALKNKTPGINVLLFNDDGEREHFTSLINSPSNLLALLKMKLFGGRMVLLTVKELAERIDEMKEVL